MELTYVTGNYGKYISVKEQFDKKNKLNHRNQLSKSIN